MTRAGLAAGSTYGAATYGSAGGGAGAAIGGGGGAGGGLWAHAATSAKADAIISGLAKLTTVLSLIERHTLSIDSVAFVQPKGRMFFSQR